MYIYIYIYLYIRLYIGLPCGVRTRGACQTLTGDCVRATFIQTETFLWSGSGKNSRNFKSVPTILTTQARRDITSDASRRTRDVHLSGHARPGTVQEITPKPKSTTRPCQGTRTQALRTLNDTKVPSLPPPAGDGPWGPGGGWELPRRRASWRVWEGAVSPTV